MEQEGKCTNNANGKICLSWHSLDGARVIADVCLRREWESMEAAAKLFSLSLLLLLQSFCIYGAVSTLRLCADQNCESEYIYTRGSLCALFILTQFIAMFT